MKALQQIFSSPLTEALGWTLLHSLWQVLLVVILVVIARRLLSHAASHIRYLIACGGLFVAVISCIVTFFMLSTSASTIPVFVNAATNVNAGNVQQPEVSPDIFSTAIMAIESNMPLIITIWLAGTLLFSLRLMSGWFYVIKLKNNALEPDKNWDTLLKQLAGRLQIKRAIKLAESAMIDAPIVIGYLKPVILVPVGMFTGLTTEQIETIFVHELAHIKRHDYLINLLQSVIESILFFNPFIWMLSQIIRNEREYCCDDVVVSRHGSAIAYAHALTRLEEARLSKNVLALSLAENKNQLFNRIKRIMEKSVKNYSGRERIVPAILVIIGLVCASWLTVHSEKSLTSDMNKPMTADQSVLNDTTIKKSEKSARYSRKKITTTGADGQPHEEIVENFEGDEEFRPLMAPPDLAFTPSAPGSILTFPAMPDVSDMFLSLHPDAFTDTIPGSRHRLRSSEEWKEFNAEFEKKFKEKFGDFYKEHGKDLEKMLNELSEKFDQRVNREELLALREFGLAQADLERIQQELQHARIPLEELSQIQELAEFSMKDTKELQELRAAELEGLQENLEAVRENMELMQLDRMSELRELEVDLKMTEENMKQFEKELKEQLIKDGYLKKNDELKTVDWGDNGELKINGKKIKDSDRARYESLQRKYIRIRSGYFRQLE